MTDAIFAAQANAARPAPADAVDPPRPTVDYQKIVSSAVAVFVANGAIVNVEPSPYDLLFFIAMPLWFVGGFAVHRSVVLLACLLFGFTLAGFAALVPHWALADSSVFQYLSAYLALTALFFALFVGNRTSARIEVVFKAYAAGAAFASVCAILGYFDVAGLSDAFTSWGRAMGTFKDPNVYGPFCVLGVVYLVQGLLLRRTRWLILSSGVLIVIVTGVLLSFSRGAWGAVTVATAMMAGSHYLTTDNAAIRRRIALGAVLAVAAVAIVLVVLLSIEQTREMFFLRASVTQDYDEGATGRFGNQMRSIPMLIDRFFGFGPLLFRNHFGIEPHNSYIGAFANTGWVGGLIFILLVMVTTFVGFRLIARPSPYRDAAQVAFPALFVFFLQAFQIDIDHWRHVFLLLGLVWGLEAARQRWEEAQDAETPPLTPPPASPPGLRRGPLAPGSAP